MTFEISEYETKFAFQIFSTLNGKDITKNGLERNIQHIPGLYHGELELQWHVRIDFSAIVRTFVFFDVSPYQQPKRRNKFNNVENLLVISMGSKRAEFRYYYLKLWKRLRDFERFREGSSTM